MSSLQPWVTSFIEALHVIGKMSVPFGKLLLFPWLWDLASIVIIGNSTEVTRHWHTSVTHAKESWNMSKLKDVPTLSIKSCFNLNPQTRGLQTHHAPQQGHRGKEELPSAWCWRHCSCNCRSKMREKHWSLFLNIYPTAGVTVAGHIWKPPQTI